MEKSLLGELKKHISSVGFGFLLLMSYILDNHKWMDELIPSNIQPFALITILMIAILYEFSYKRYKELKELVLKIEKDQKVLSLKAAVNGLYHRVSMSGDKYIDTEYARLELASLTDELIKLKVNSYTQKKIEELNEMVKPSKDSRVR